MKIDNLRLINFRCHQDLAIGLGALTLIRGSNASGKSSIQMAIEYALTGRNCHTDQAGRGAEELIRKGAEKFEIGLVATVDGKAYTLRAGRDRRTGGVRLSQGSMELAGADARNWIYNAVAPVDIITAVLDAHRFAYMTARERKALLATVLADDQLQLPGEIMDALEAVHFNANGVIEAPVIDTIDQLYKKAYDFRTEINRTIKHLEGIETFTPEEDMPTPEKVEEQIQELQRDLNAKHAEKSKLLLTWSTSGATRKKLIAEKAAAEPLVLSDATIEAHRKTINNKLTIEKLDAEIQRLQTAINTDRQTVSSTKAGAPCPTCHQIMPAIDHKPLEDRIRVAEKDLAAAQAKRLKLGDPATANEQMEAHRRAASTLARAERELAELPAETAAPDTFELDAEIETLEARLKHGREVLVKVSAAAAKLKAHQDAMQELQRRRLQHSALEKLLTYFGPDGIKGSLMKGKAALFIDRLNRILAEFGYHSSIVTSPELQIEVFRRETGAGPIDIDLLSESEIYRVSIAVQIALAEFTKVGLVVADGADILDPEARSVLMQELSTGGLEQAIVLATGPETPVPPYVTSVYLTAPQEATADV